MNFERAREIVQRLLDPTPFDVFIRDVFSRRVVKLDGRTHKDWRVGLLGDDPESVILAGAGRFAHRIISHAAAPTGPAPPLESLSTLEAFRSKIEAFQERGYTVRLSEIRAMTPQLAELTRALEFVFHRPMQPDLYWSRGDAKAPIHHDDFDLFVIQLRGRKLWRISTDPSDLPNPWRSAPAGSEKLERYVEIEVEPGDVLYLPRGATHSVDAIAESIHVSIGFAPLTLRETMIACVDLLSELDRTIRDNVEPRTAADLARGDFGDTPARVRAGLARLLDHCRAVDFLAEALQRRATRIVANFDPLMPAAADVAVTPATRVRHTPLAIAHITGATTTLDFAYPGGRQYIHRGAEPAVRFMAVTPEFYVRELPGEIGDDVRAALVGKFIAIGFLEIAKP